MSLPPNRNILKDYANTVYVETGIWRGDSLRLAIDAGFKQIIGIDFFDENIEFCMSRFRMKRPTAHTVDNAIVTLFKGDSAQDLGYVLPDAQCTIFLDAHSQYLEDEKEAFTPYPLLRELEQIQQHAIKTHTIIIDDVLHLTHPFITGWSRDIIEDALRAINPAYNITYIANPVKNNLLICTV